jgi:hypothetical protein
MAFSLMFLGAADSFIASLRDYWMSKINTSTTLTYAAAVDSSDNFYTFGWTTASGVKYEEFYLVKYGTAGTIQWERTLGGNLGDRGNGVASDSSNNVYVYGETQDGGGLMAKYDSSGTFQWQRVLGGVTNTDGFAIAIDSSDNLYVLGRTQATGGVESLLAKYDSAGTIQWQRTLGGANVTSGYAVATDSNNDVYVTGYTRIGGVNKNVVLIAKYNSAGTVQWQQTLDGTSSQTGYAIATDSNNDVYVVGRTRSSGAGDYDLLFVKYSSAGIIQWQRTLGGADSDSGYGIAIDSADNIYASGRTSSVGPTTKCLVAKYDSSGNLQWQRALGWLDGATYSDAIAVDSFGDVFVTANGTDIVAKLPGDGSLLGTYTINGADIEYFASTLTHATSTLTDATSSLTEGISSLTSTTPTYSSLSASIGQLLIEL